MRVGSPDLLAPWLRLSLTPGVGNDTARRLLAAFGLPQSIFDANRSALRSVVSAAQADALLQPPPGWEPQWALTLAWLSASDNAPGDPGVARSVVTLGDPGYPAGLLQMEDPPLLLYLLGCGHFDATRRGMVMEASLAIVGTRNPSPQGAENARLFARAFSDAGLTVVSGMATGVDGAAHLGALEGAHPQPGAKTVAVVGTGLDRVYPRQHRALAHQIAAQGVLVSEYPLGTPPLASNFPRRNRLIAGLSCGTLVVEAALKSGSLITARLAAEQGKEVFSIPGSIHSAQSRGCHALIRQGAKLVEAAADVLEEIKHLVATKKEATTANETSSYGVSDPDSSLLAAIGHDPVALDALQARTGIDTASLQAQLLMLELDGKLARLPGGLFQRMAVA